MDHQIERLGNNPQDQIQHLAIHKSYCMDNDWPCIYKKEEVELERYITLQHRYQHQHKGHMILTHKCRDWLDLHYNPYFQQGTREEGIHIDRLNSQPSLQYKY